jgi:hypothetical protein
MGGCVPCRAAADVGSMIRRALRRAFYSTGKISRGFALEMNASLKTSALAVRIVSEAPAFYKPTIKVDFPEFVPIYEKSNFSLKRLK